ncbi:MAG: hypothetical protein QXI84_07965 [Thermofilaceae archaeon]
MEKIFAEKVMEWYKSNRRSFPWRVGMSSEWITALTAILLRKTRAETVAKHYERIIKALETPERALQLKIEEIEELLKPLGLHKTRARQIRQLAEAWGKSEKLPGLGPYALSLIDCLHKRKLVVVVDVNTARVASRFFGVDRGKVEEELKKIVEAAGTCEINLAIMDFAAKICTPRKPKCGKCTLAENCAHRRRATATPNPAQTG